MTESFFLITCLLNYVETIIVSVSIFFCTETIYLRSTIVTYFRDAFFPVYFLMETDSIHKYFIVVTVEIETKNIRLGISCGIA